jgi:hypothetical protein
MLGRLSVGLGRFGRAAAVAAGGGAALAACGATASAQATDAQFDALVGKHQAAITAKDMKGADAIDLCGDLSKALPRTASMDVVDVDSVIAKQHDFFKRTDKLFIWHTLREEAGWLRPRPTKRMLNRVAVWRWIEPQPASDGDVQTGLARVGAAVSSEWPLLSVAHRPPLTIAHVAACCLARHVAGACG